MAGGNRRLKPEERGAALLTVLLLVAVISGLAVVALDKLRLATRLAANGAAADQARGFAIGAEALAIARVGLLSDRRLARTSLARNWMNRAYRVPVPGGGITARLADGGNCFNLNSVVAGADPTKLAVRPVGVAQFVGLMQALNVPQREAEAVAWALADWIDGDIVPQPLGAEDEVYARADTPYRTGNTFVADSSELRAVAGVSPMLYATLKPFLCALPTADLAPINVNTLEEEQAPLIAMLIPGVLPVASARALIAARPADGWADTSQFWKGPALAALVPLAEVQAQPTVRTRWFRLTLDVDLAGSQVREVALVDGARTPAKVVARRWGDDE